ncbi:tRNA-dihydrouridine synthase [Candidatus Saccharibacteria bacterium]|nr:tRNA-dihydrouridine synthase [Candidatus Saccharibacteria bacterium]
MSASFSWHNDLPRPFFILAPMEAVTDVVFRHVVAQAARPDVFFSEFTNATGWAAAGDKAVGGRLVKTDDESPIIAQLWGSKPEAMAKMAIRCRELGFDGIDINMGCPDSSAVKSGGGAGMIRTPQTAAEIIANAKTSGLPVSVKTRLGFSRVDEWREWLTHILRQDVVNLTIHLRTKKEMSKVPAHYELIPEIKKLRDEIAPHTLLTINGDIRDRQHGMELYETYGVDGIMIGRGIFHNPFAFERKVTSHTKQELLELLNLQLNLHEKYSRELGERKFDPLKRFFKIYVREFDGASELRDSLMRAKSVSEVREILVAHNFSKA